MAHMDVLLSEDVENLGQRGEVVRVRVGYGRNYLLPQGLAIQATAGNKRMIEEQRRVLAKRENRERASAEGEASKLEGLTLRFDRRVGEHGILFGSVTSLDIVEALKGHGYTVERRRVGLREPIKEVGDYDVTIKLHRDVTPTIKVRVRKEGAPDELEAAAPAAEAAPETQPEAAGGAAATPDEASAAPDGAEGDQE
ncbi:MAG TPA: 50S ribosomal protein L9 [Blastocatellia bacterium]|nr:50S ribosomal protein L9 [Blastocatellia bacterium]